MWPPPMNAIRITGSSVSAPGPEHRGADPDDGRTLGGQTLRERATDATAGSRYQRNFAGQYISHGLLAPVPCVCRACLRACLLRFYRDDAGVQKAKRMRQVDVHGLRA